VRHVDANRVGIALVIGIPAALVAGLVAVSHVMPDPSDGPTPPATRVAYYLLFAACLVALAAIPLVIGALDRLAGRRPDFAWRLLLLVGAVPAMLVLGWGVRTWAYPPHNLRRCFTDYRGNGHSGIWGHICESGLANIPLGDSRLLEGFLGAVLISFAFGVTAARMALPPNPAASPSNRPQSAGSGTGRR
jgi:MFS family permease